MPRPVYIADFSNAISLPYNANANQPNDEYDSLGRNISRQKRRQDSVPWIQVSYDRTGGFWFII